ncbi:hypothetical protein [Noviherbaspirillum sp. Root189]|uniref:hypothetical protein n=1 Tax=Noviherbaspirillum sp. Root189 TaxID=1736487 RepID=UPI002689ADA0
MKRKKTVDPNQLELALLFSPDTERRHETDAVTRPAAPHSPVSIPVRANHTLAEQALPPASEGVPESKFQPEPGPEFEAASEEALQAVIQEPRLWSESGWTARVTMNDNSDGWAVEMTMDGDAGPSLVMPWPKERGSDEPKPLDVTAVATLIKNAAAERRKHEKQLHAMLHKSVKVATRSAMVTVALDISPDEDNATATLTAYDEFAVQLAQVRVAPTFKLNKASAAKWIDSQFRRPER